MLDSLNEIIVTTIDLEDVLSDFSEEYTIPLPNDILNVSGEQKATLTLKLRGMKTKQIETSNIVFKNVPEGYTPELVTNTVAVTIRGLEETVDLIQESNILVRIDLADYDGATGVFPTPIEVEILLYSDVGVVGDYEAYVNMQLDSEVTG